jgi:hypothetical protein
LRKKSVDGGSAAIHWVRHVRNPLICSDRISSKEPVSCPFFPNRDFFRTLLGLHCGAPVTALSRQRPNQRTLIGPAEAPRTRARSSRNGGRNHSGTPSEIKSECWARSSRIRGRLPRNPRTGDHPAGAVASSREQRNGLFLAPFLGLRCIRLAGRIRYGIPEGRKGHHSRRCWRRRPWLHRRLERARKRELRCRAGCGDCLCRANTPATVNERRAAPKQCRLGWRYWTRPRLCEVI